MRSNRRSVLIGLGTLTVGGGAILGTGAFSSVEAQRNVNINTAGDSSALLGLNITSSTLQGSGDTISFELGNGVNLDAVTKFSGLELTNNRENSGDTVNISIYEGTDTSETGTELSLEPDPTLNDSTNVGMYFEKGSSDALTNLAGGGASVSLEVIFNLLGETATESSDGANDNADAQIPDTITIVAEDSS